MKKIEITIPKPCHESWTKMTPSEQGRFCDQCAKEVIDFSQLSDAELIDQLQKTPKGCGRFTPAQIQRTYAVHNKNQHWKRATTLLFPILLSSSSLLAQTVNKPIKTQVVSSEKRTSKPAQKVRPTRYIQGVVMDLNQETLIGVTVIIENTELGTISDIDGGYELEIPAHLGDTATISFHYTGYESQSIQVSPSQQNLNIKLEGGDFIVGELLVVGGYTSKPRTLVGVVPRWLRQWSHKRVEKAALNQKQESSENIPFTDPILTTETPSTKFTNLTCQVNLQVFPNPFDHFIKVEFSLSTAQKIQLELVNNFGQVLGNQQYEAFKGPNTFNWEINPLTRPSGIYYLRLTQQNGQQETVTLIAQ